MKSSRRIWWSVRSSWGFVPKSLKRSPRADEFRKELEEDKIFEYLTDEADIQEESV